MKRLSFLIVLILLLTLFPLAACVTETEEGVVEETPVSGSFLSVSGTQFINEDNQTVTLRGVNLGGLFVQEGWMCPGDFEGYFDDVLDVLSARFGAEKAQSLVDIWEESYVTESDIQKIADIGMNCVRLPFTWRTLQNTDYTYKENCFEKMDRVISWCAERDIYVILDLHGAHGSQNGRHHSGTTKRAALYTSPDNQDLTVELWKTVATHYKDNKWVAAYDLLNEPELTPGGSTGIRQNVYHKVLYDAIRTVDATHAIIMEACWEPTVMPNPSFYGFQNVAYEYHYYGWDKNNVEDMNAFTDSKVTMLAESNGKEIPALVGEFTYFELWDSWEYALGVYNREGYSWTIWTYKVNGKGSSWGLYTGDTEAPDFNNDTYEEIARKWSQVKTADSYEENSTLVNIVKKFC